MPRTRKFKHVSDTEAARWAEEFALGAPIQKIAKRNGRSWKTVQNAIQNHDTLMDKSMSNGRYDIDELQEQHDNALMGIRPEGKPIGVCYDCRVLIIDWIGIRMHDNHAHETFEEVADRIFRVIIDVHADSVNELVHGLDSEGELVSISEIGKR